MNSLDKINGKKLSQFAILTIFAKEYNISNEIDMNIVKNYVDGLKKAYYDENGKEVWNHFEKIKHGVSKENITKLKETFPNIPNSLINLLEYVDGTYYREYEGEEIIFYFLGSDVGEYGYPYYLLSAKEIIENIKHTKNLAKMVEEIRDYDDSAVDDKISVKPSDFKWLHFSDCMNNGGTSRLYVDFSPSTKGKVGQIIRFLHDSDELKVIADSFDDYLKMLINNDYAFINEDTMEE
ncbi:MAG: SMI1/KNR4 family protein [Chitinispirillales bacterium]|nr:SMI1/KNR4 family protein [Chitinispirillales bacterium]